MSNNKFYFEFKSRISKIYDFFSLSSLKKKLQLQLISKVYHFYLIEIYIYIYIYTHICVYISKL